MRSMLKSESQKLKQGQMSVSVTKNVDAQLNDERRFLQLTGICLSLESVHLLENVLLLDVWTFQFHTSEGKGYICVWFVN